MLTELSQFILQAKLSTIANGAEGKWILLEDGSHELAYGVGDFHFSDVWQGYNPFIGHQLVWQAGQLAWGMNYYGKAFGESAPASQVYCFLRQALSQARPDRPFRGPDFFRAGSFTYVNRSNGFLEDFTGEERVYFRGEQVYHMFYQGGKIAQL